MRLTVWFNTVERGRARLSTVEHGRETVEIRYTAVQRGSFNRTLPRSTAARWDLGIKLDTLAGLARSSDKMVTNLLSLASLAEGFTVQQIPPDVYGDSHFFDFLLYVIYNYY